MWLTFYMHPLMLRNLSRRCESDKCGTFQAKNALRRKKKIESLRDGKETALENIRHMLRIIQQVESDKMVRINVVTPVLWSSLPKYVQSSYSGASFRKVLKTQYRVKN